MEVLRIIVALLVFGIIVLFHEYGHYIVARKSGIIVDEFAIGMGPKIAGVKNGDTEFTIRALPIGGACMMRGEDTAEECEEGSFNSRPVWQRIAVVFAGPFFNFIMAFVCAVIIVGASGYMSGEILEVMENSPAQEAGFEAGDKILKVDRTSVHIFSDFRMYIALNQSKSCDVTVLRDGEKKVITVTPKLDDDGIYRIGIVGGVIERPGPGGTLISAFYEVKSNINVVIKSLEMLIAGKVSSRDISGPVGIFTVIGDSYSDAVQYGVKTVILTILDLILLLSANLGVMNLLPIPALDGGRLVFLAVEAVRGKPVSREKEGMVHFIGFVLLMIIMALVMFNDIARIAGY